MRITPLDVRKQEFNKGMRGYDCAEVQAFLSTLADEYEAVLVDNKQIRERVMEQDEKLAEYQSMERNLRDTLMTAERVMQETRENANKEGDLLIKDAEMKARGILEECRLRTEELRREIVALRKEKETYLARFKSLAEAQIQFVETHKSDFDDLDRRLVDIVDSVVAGASKAETRPSPQAAAPKTATAAMPTAAMPTAAMPVTPPAPAHDQGPDPFASSPEAPAENPAPAGNDQDIWRDYNPGAAASDGAPAETGNEDNGIADIVSETFAETGAPAEGGHDSPEVAPEAAPKMEGIDAPTPEVDLGDEEPAASGDQPAGEKGEGWGAKEEEKTPASIW